MFEVDLKGLSQLIEDTGPARLVAELVSNSLDEDGVTAVNVTVGPVAGRPLALVTVEDDAPGGFADLSHAYTLFAPSYKKTRAEKRGRFNLGDKLFLAAAILTGEPARIASTTGAIEFTVGGDRRTTRDRRDRGSVVSGCLKMTREQYAEVIALLRSLLHDDGVALRVNDERLPSREPVRTFAAKLPTVLADEAGVLRQRVRETTVRLFEPLPGEAAGVYELGVPVVETGDKYHVCVGQKVPLTLDRTNVPPSYLRLVRTLVLNETADLLRQDEASEQWVREATSEARCSPAAVEAVVTHRFGEKRTVFDPNDREANANAVANGYTVIHGSMLSKGEWENVRAKAPVAPSGRLFPTLRPYDGGSGAPAVEFVDPAEYTPGMRRVVRFTEFLHERMVGEPVRVRINAGRNEDRRFFACYCRSPNELHYNLPVLGQGFFDEFGPDHLGAFLKLFIHEVGHHAESNHLSEAYHKALCDIGGKLAHLCLTEPDLVRQAVAGE